MKKTLGSVPARAALAVLASLAALSTPALAAERLVVVPLTTSGEIAPAIAEGFRAQVRALAEARADVLDGGAAENALATSGSAPDCQTDACADGIAGAAGARFVLMGAVDNTDEIYKVRLSLYDRSTKSRRAAEGLCELCAAEEVDRTLAVTFAELQPALAVAAPPAVAPPVAVEVTTTPAGADVALDGKPIGQSPIVLKMAPGQHRVQISKAGMKPAERTVDARAETIKLAVTLVPAPVAVVLPPPVVVPPPVVTPPVTAPEPALDEGESDGGYLYTGAGLIVGGTLLTAGGIVAILLDGDVTCSDGLGVRECPTVYNTKGVGMTALGLGAGLLGAGITLIIVDVLDDAPVTPSAAITPDGAVMGFGGRF